MLEQEGGAEEDDQKLAEENIPDPAGPVLASKLFGKST
jgi:hypothetical protein